MVLRKSFSFSDFDATTKYVCVIDVFDRGEVRQFILFMAPSSKEKIAPRIFFVPTSNQPEIEDDGREYAVFSRMVEKIDEGMKKEEDLLKNECGHGFSKECLRLMIIVISDYFMFRDRLLEKYDHCIDLQQYACTLRSFSFECIENTALSASYEQSQKKKIDEIMMCM